MTISRQAFVNLHLRLLTEEHQFEEDQNSEILKCSPSELEEVGLILTKLVVDDVKVVGIFNRSLVTFVSADKTNLPSQHKFRAGDFASLFYKDSQHAFLVGVVESVFAKSICVSLRNGDFQKEHSSLTFQLTKALHGNVTHNRLTGALNSLATSDQVFVLFGERTLPDPLPAMPAALTDRVSGELVVFNQKLDDGQRAAVRFCLLQTSLTVLHGPPGTGKTTTVVELIRQHVKLGDRILVCAPSNTAVDNILAHLVKCGGRAISAVRLGHPSRIAASLQRYSLDARVAAHPDAQLLRDIQTELATANRVLREHLHADMKRISLSITKDVLEHSNVVLSTLTGASDRGPLRRVKDDYFQLVVIDECAQSVEAACWLAVPRASKLLISGDHRQLPATIMNRGCEEAGLGVSLMERCVELFGDAVTCTLTTQYRMNAAIQNWPSQQMYHSKLQPALSVASHKLHELSSVSCTDDTTCVLLHIDTAGCDLLEEGECVDVERFPRRQPGAGGLLRRSHGNPGEADIVAAHVASLVKAGVAVCDVGVITPYSRQAALITARLRERDALEAVEVNSVDGFQGREKEAIVVSLVRSNTRAEVGFLRERRRINVAVTRARRHLAVVADSETVGRDQFIGSLLEYISSEGEVRSAADYERHIGSVSVTKPASTSTNKPAPTSTNKAAPTNTNKAAAKKNAKKKTRVVTASKAACDKNKPHVHHERPKLAAAGDSEQNGAEQSGDSPAQLGPEEDDVVARLSEVIDEFHVSDRAQMQLSQLNAFERLQVHQLCEQRGLNHASSWDAGCRTLCVSKNTGDKEKQLNDAASSSSSCSDAKTTAGAQYQLCSTCNKEVPKNNMHLHKLRCLNKPCVVNENRGRAQKSGKREVKKSSVARGYTDGGNDDDAVLEAMLQSTRRCNYYTCRMSGSSALLLQCCTYCKLTFCLRHSLAEEHGCGAAARRTARASRTASNSQSSQRPPHVHSHLRRKLTTKIDSLQSSRARTAREENH